MGDQLFCHQDSSTANTHYIYASTRVCNRTTLHTLFTLAFVFVPTNICQPTNSSIGIQYKYTCKYKCSTPKRSTIIYTNEN